MKFEFQFCSEKLRVRQSHVVFLMKLQKVCVVISLPKALLLKAPVRT